MTRRSTPSRSPRPTTGMPADRAWPARRAKTSTSRSRPATTSSRGGGWSRPRASTIASSSSAPSAGARPTFKRRSSMCDPGLSARSAWPAAWIHQKRVNIGHGQPGRCPPASITPCGKGPPPTGRITRTASTTTGTGSGTGGPASWETTAFTASTSARWGLGVDAPLAVSSGGGKYVFDDDQETPDTQIATWEFPSCCLVCEHRIWSNHRHRGQPFRHRLLRGQGNADHRRQRLAGRSRATAPGASRRRRSGAARCRTFSIASRAARRPMPTSRSAI